MKTYTASVARERLADALDEAQRGEPVIIERKGVRYRLTLEPETAPKRTSRRKSRIETIDPAIDEGNWTWDLTAKGLRFRRR